jgi:hypothetical protein
MRFLNEYLDDFSHKSNEPEWESILPRLGQEQQNRTIEMQELLRCLFEAEMDVGVFERS